MKVGRSTAQVCRQELKSRSFAQLVSSWSPGLGARCLSATLRRPVVSSSHAARSRRREQGTGGAADLIADALEVYEEELLGGSEGEETEESDRAVRSRGQARETQRLRVTGAEIALTSGSREPPTLLRPAIRGVWLRSALRHWSCGSNTVLIVPFQSLTRSDWTQARALVKS